MQSGPRTSVRIFSRPKASQFDEPNAIVAFYSKNFGDARPRSSTEPALNRGPRYQPRRDNGLLLSTSSPRGSWHLAARLLNGERASEARRTSTVGEGRNDKWLASTRRGTLGRGRYWERSTDYLRAVDKASRYEITRNQRRGRRVSVGGARWLSCSISADILTQSRGGGGLAGKAGSCDGRVEKIRGEEKNR